MTRMFKAALARLVRTPDGRRLLREAKRLTHDPDRRRQIDEAAGRMAAQAPAPRPRGRKA